jgi:hypothetical protein
MFREDKALVNQFPAGAEQIDGAAGVGASTIEAARWNVSVIS